MKEESTNSYDEFERIYDIDFTETICDNDFNTFKQKFFKYLNSYRHCGETFSDKFFEIFEENVLRKIFNICKNLHDIIENYCVRIHYFSKYPNEHFKYIKEFYAKYNIDPLTEEDVKTLHEFVLEWLKESSMLHTLLHYSLLPIIKMAIVDLPCIGRSSIIFEPLRNLVENIVISYQFDLLFNAITYKGKYMLSHPRFINVSKLLGTKLKKKHWLRYKKWVSKILNLDEDTIKKEFQEIFIKKIVDLYYEDNLIDLFLALHLPINIKVFKKSIGIIKTEALSQLSILKSKALIESIEESSIELKEVNEMIEYLKSKDPSTINQEDELKIKTLLEKEFKSTHLILYLPKYHIAKRIILEILKRSKEKHQDKKEIKKHLEKLIQKIEELDEIRDILSGYFIHFGRIPKDEQIIIEYGLETHRQLYEDIITILDKITDILQTLVEEEINFIYIT